MDCYQHKSKFNSFKSDIILESSVCINRATSQGCLVRSWNNLCRKSRYCSKCRNYHGSHRSVLIPFLIAMVLLFAYITTLSLFIMFNMERLEKSSHILHVFMQPHPDENNKNTLISSHLNDTKNISHGISIGEGQNLSPHAGNILDFTASGVEYTMNDEVNDIKDSFILDNSSSSSSDLLIVKQNVKNLFYDDNKSKIPQPKLKDIKGSFISDNLYRKRRSISELFEYKRKVRQTSEELMARVKSFSECFKKVEEFNKISENLQNRMISFSIEAIRFKESVMKEMYKRCKELINNPEKSGDVNCDSSKSDMFSHGDKKQLELEYDFEKPAQDYSYDCSGSNSCAVMESSEKGPVVLKKGTKESSSPNINDQKHTKPYEFGSVKVVNRPFPPTGPDGIPFFNSSGEIIKTSQQLSYSIPQIVQPFCYYVPKLNNYGDFASGRVLQLVCIPSNRQHFSPQNQFQNIPAAENFHHNSQSIPAQQNICNQCVLNVPSQARRAINHDDDKPEKMIHIPTALSSPNPYYLPLSILSNFPDTFASQYGNKNFQFGLSNKDLPSQFLVPSQNILPYNHFPPGQVQTNFLNEMQNYNNFRDLRMMIPFDCGVFQPNSFTQTLQFPTVPGVSETRLSKEVKDSVESSFETNYFMRASTGNNYNLSTAPKDMSGSNCHDGFACESGECVPVSAVCDSKVDCRDASDEMSCSCRDRVDKGRICDGYFDCPHGEDELGCFGCSVKSFSCGNWYHYGLTTTCVPLEKRCDDIIDCPDGKDEKECSILADSVGNNELFIVSYAAGYLHHNWRGKWYPACPDPITEESVWARSACTEEVGYDDRKPMINMVSVKTHDDQMFLLPNKKGIEIVNGCRHNGFAAHVTCSHIHCGTRSSINDLENENFIDGSRRKRFVMHDYYEPRSMTSADWRSDYNNLLYNNTTQSGKSYDDNLNNDSNSKLHPYHIYDKLLPKAFFDLFFQYDNSDNEQSSGKSNLDPEVTQLNASTYQSPSDSHAFQNGMNNSFKNQDFNESIENSFNLTHKVGNIDMMNRFKIFNKNLLNLNNRGENFKNPDEKLYKILNESLLIAGKDDMFTTTYNPEVLSPYSESILRIPREEGRVVGGVNSKPAKWPWIVALYQDGHFHCGGVIISDLWIMTAAHCVDNYINHYYEVQAGMLRRFSFSPMEQTRTVSHIILHEKYVRSVMQNDLALLLLARPFQFNRWVRPICLPFQLPLVFPPPGTVCTAVGWGATVEHGPDPDHMREVEVPVLPSCKHRPDQEGAELCAGALEGGRDTCQGDSGGPLLCRSPSEVNRWFVAGIVSHGEGCARPFEPGVYTRVSLFLDWIKEKIAMKTLPQSRPKPYCPGYECSNHFHCIPEKMKCNGRVDCLHGDDEIGCSYESSFLNKLSPQLSLNYKKNVYSHSESIGKSHLPDVDCSFNGTHSLGFCKSNPNQTFNNFGNISGNSTNRTKVQQNHKDLKIVNNTEITWLPFVGNNDKKSYLEFSTVVNNITDAELGYREGKEEGENNIDFNVSDSSRSHLEQHMNLSKTEIEVSYNQILDENSSTPFYESDEMDDYDDENYEENDGRCSGYQRNCTSQDKNNDYYDNHFTTGIQEMTTYINNDYYSDTFSGEVQENTTSNINDGMENSVERKNYDYYDSQTYNQSNDYYSKFENRSVEIRHDYPSNFSDSYNNAEFDLIQSKLSEISSKENYHIAKYIDGHSKNHSPKMFQKQINNTTYDKGCVTINEKFRLFTSNNIMNFTEENYISKLTNNIESEYKYRDKMTNLVYLKPSYLKKLGVTKCWSNAKNFTSSILQKNNSSNTSNSTVNLMSGDIPFWLFSCHRLHQYIPFYMKCNGKFDCEDGSDEINCTCWDILLARQDNLICDGIVDCPDHSDEENCFYVNCPDDKILSPPYNLHCSKQRQDFNTLILSNGNFSNYNNVDQLEFLNRGLVTEYTNNEWKPFCLSKTSPVIIALKVCHGLSYVHYNYMKFVKFDYTSIQNPVNSTTSVPDNCIGLEVECSGLTEISESPWLAFVRLEGEIIASAALITLSILVADLKSFQNIEPGKQYVSASLGSGRLMKISQLSLYEQNIRINYIYRSSSGFAALQLSKPAQLTHLVKPLGIMFPWFVKDFTKRCITVEYASVNNFSQVELELSSAPKFEPLKTNVEDYDWKNDAEIGDYSNSIESIDHDAVRRNKISIFDVRKTPDQCHRNIEMPQSGVIVCESPDGWYASATYYLDETFCNFTGKIYSSRSIEEFTNDLMDVEKNIENEKNESDWFDEIPDCNGWRCPRGRCLNWDKVGNGLADCEDGSDESSVLKERKSEFCSSNGVICECLQDQLRCFTGECIDKHKYCDGEKDCLDGSDEMDFCDTNCTMYLERSSKHLLCDGVRNCLDKSDESWEYCGNSTCEIQNSFMCASSNKCIPQEFLCDGDEDCPSGEDESNCLAFKDSVFSRLEGIIIQQKFGVWIPLCINSVPSNDVLNEICRSIGLSQFDNSRIVQERRMIFNYNAFNSIMFKRSNGSFVFRTDHQLLIPAPNNSTCDSFYLKCI